MSLSFGLSYVTGAPTRIRSKDTEVECDKGEGVLRSPSEREEGPHKKETNWFTF